MVRYFRPSDYYYMAGSTLAFPGALWLMESASPARGKGKLSAAMKLSAVLGLCVCAHRDRVYGPVARERVELVGSELYARNVMANQCALRVALRVAVAPLHDVAVCINSCTVGRRELHIAERAAQ